MLNQIKGLHHVTSLASGAQSNNDFFTKTLGLRRVKKTVNFDAPDVYHLYYGDGTGAPGSVMTYFPFPNAARGRPGVGEVGTTVFSVPTGTLDEWQTRLASLGVQGLDRETLFGENRLKFDGPDGDGFALVEQADDDRTPWTGNGVSEDLGIRGFHSASMRLADDGATGELLKFMGYEDLGTDGDTRRFAVADGTGANTVDIQTLPGAAHAAPVIDRDYFWAIYFRTPGGVLFEVATNEPGFDADEDTAHLGEALKLPPQHAHLREKLEQYLEPIEG